MTNDIPALIRQHQSRLTGLPEAAFLDLTLEQKIDLIRQWHTSSVVAEQMMILSMALAMLEDGINDRELKGYLGSKESRQEPLGRFGWLTGLSQWPRRVWKVFLPLLRIGGYRPFITETTAGHILDISSSGDFGNLEPGAIADALYQRGDTPFAQRKFLKSVKAFAKKNPQMGREMARLLIDVREQARHVVADSGEMEQRVESIEETHDVAPADDGA